MVFVSVRKHNRANGAAILLQISYIGDYDIDAKKLRFRKHQSSVDHNNVVCISQGEHVHAKFAQSAKGDS